MSDPKDTGMAVDGHGMAVDARSGLAGRDTVAGVMF